MNWLRKVRSRSYLTPRNYKEVISLGCILAAGLLIGYTYTRKNGGAQAVHGLTRLENLSVEEYKAKRLFSNFTDILSTDPTIAVSTVSTAPPGNDLNWTQVQLDRIRLLQERCKGHAISVQKRAFNGQIITDKSRGFLYCPVEKVASTFMRRFMYGLARHPGAKTVPYPYHIPIDTALQFKFDTLRNVNVLDYRAVFRTRFLIVREPFSRLFSAYVDKLVPPNHVYWKWWAVPAILQSRKNPSAHSRECGHDVTFSEFVKYVIQTLHRKDNHVRPVKDLCSPCDMEYSVIGLSETVGQDFQYLVQTLNISFKNVSLEELGLDSVKDAIMDSTRSAFFLYGKLQMCLTKLQMGERLWKKMQLRGVISNDIAFPLSEEEMNNATAASFIELLLQNYEKSNRTALHDQKYQDLVQAYKTIAVEDIRKLTEIYSSDFEYFGYSKKPDFITASLGWKS